MAIDAFAGHRYLNLETYRKTGIGVRTPVWFAEDGARLFAYSIAEAGKVKRIRNNGRVKIAPCDIRGALKGSWLDARARIVSGEEEALGHHLLDAKYGWQKMLGNLSSRILNRKRAVIAIEPLA